MRVRALILQFSIGDSVMKGIERHCLALLHNTAFLYRNFQKQA